MFLSDLSKALMPLAARGLSDVEIVDLAYDSRQVVAGSLFFALRGQAVDGHRFLKEAAARGAVAAVVDTWVEDSPLPQLRVADTRAALARAASQFLGVPSSRLTIIGITGTNGKTTISYLLTEILKSAGKAPGLIGTVAYRCGEECWPAPHTTPESLDLQRLFQRMGDLGATHIVMEVSSHGLAQARIEGTPFAVAVFTNLTQDHLDFHVSMDEYFKAKERLFTEILPASGASVPAVINYDDPYGQKLLKSVTQPVITYGLSKEAEVHAEDWRLSLTGLKAKIKWPNGCFTVYSPLVGLYNLSNILAATAAALALKIKPEAIKNGIEGLANVPGRMERVAYSGSGPTVLVDYAHSPDALENILRAARDFASARVILVFGAGGDRDRGKRPLMGAAAARGADLSILTSDNPRTEKPEAIIADVETGMSSGRKLTLNQAREGARGYLVESDRRNAIRLAVELARDEDLVLVAGKGHEDYQILGRTKIHFDDREEARQALETRAAARSKA